jgi:hypothetical protein
MEKNNFEKFIKEKSHFVCSKFFIEKFIDFFFFEGFEKINESEIKFEFKFKPNQQFANFLNIVHGGSISLTFDNLANLCLYYITNNIYRNINFSILYKNQVLLNETYTVKIILERIKYKTIFITCILLNEKKIKCIEAQIIKEKKMINKL